MKVPRGKLPLSIMAIFICAVALTEMIFTEDLRALTEEKEKRNFSNYDNIIRDDNVDDRIKFNPKECSIDKGKWVFDRSKEPLYSDETCPYIDSHVACTRNGRPDSSYLYWMWKLDDCTVPRFDAAAVLEKLRGKRMVFIGDSLQREQWKSFVCMIQVHIPAELKSMNRSPSLSAFTAKEYNATIEFYWAPFLVQSNTDAHIITDASKIIVRVDSIPKNAQHWIGADILVFNTYLWWMSGQRIKSLRGCFANEQEGFEELDVVVAYRIALKTWANWIDSTIDPNVTRVFFTTMSPTHIRSSDWINEKGIKCYNETRPVTEKGHRGSGSDKRLMEVVSSVTRRMKVQVTVLNITQLSEYRIDGHLSVYTQSQGVALTKNQMANPARYADCIHWCLPGVPDTWNQLLCAYLLSE